MTLDRTTANVSLKASKEKKAGRKSSGSPEKNVDSCWYSDSTA
jgi:hypothetical protein